MPAMNATVWSRRSHPWNMPILTRTTLPTVRTAPNFYIANDVVLTAAQLVKLHLISTSTPRSSRTEQKRQRLLRFMASRTYHHHRNQQMLPTNCRLERFQGSIPNCLEILIIGQQSIRLSFLDARVYFYNDDVAPFGSCPRRRTCLLKDWHRSTAIHPVILPHLS
jgi:hypothetical protein